MLEISMNQMRRNLSQQRRFLREMDNIIERLEKYSVANKVEFRNEIRELEIQRRKWYKMIVTLEEIINSYEKAERNAKNQSLFKQNLIGYINLKPTKNILKKLKIKFQ